MNGSAEEGADTLDEVIRELVRQEIRAELAKHGATTPTQAKYISVAEYAAARSISISTVRNAVRSGRLPAIRIGAAVRVEADVELGRPVVATPTGRTVSPIVRAEEIMSAQRTRSIKRNTCNLVS